VFAAIQANGSQENIKFLVFAMILYEARELFVLDRITYEYVRHVNSFSVKSTARFTGGGALAPTSSGSGG
jgi:hypothetical protein